MSKLFTVIAFTGLCLLSCTQEKTPSPTINDFESLRKEFISPSKEYGTAPLWVWNTKITPEMIDRSLTDLKDKGFGGVFVHPRPGLITEYISDEWYALFRHALDKGKELGLNVWIYDENSYPSGFAGGHVPEQMPESYNQGQGLQLTKSDTLPANASEFFLCLKGENGKVTDITANLKSETGKTGPYYLFSKTYEGKSPWYGGYSYVDLLYPGVTQKFIDITMTGYERVAGDEFGKSVPGWFTDEPNIHSTGGIRFTPDLFEVFQERWGYDLKTNLPSLFEETGDWKTVRHNYFQTLLQLFIDRFAKICYEYCEAHNLQFTGHYWEHGWPDINDNPDNMAMYAWHQQPAIDMLFNQFNETSPTAQFGNVRSVKELRSIANQMGRERTLSETYGGGAWEETFRDYKRLGDWEYALGVNFMNQHIADLSISGARKYDYPPVFSDVEPWWPYYKTLNMHFARLSMALSAGRQNNDILVLEPTTSIWMYYAYGKSNNRYREIGQSFQTFITRLEKAQVEYDLASENTIKDHGKITKSMMNPYRFTINQRDYSSVVIPPMMENLDAATFRLLQEFAEKGGRILAFSTPAFLDGKQNAEMEKFFTENKNVQRISELNEDVIEKQFASNRILSFSKQEGGNLYHHRREMRGGQVLFLVNSDLDEASKGTLTIQGQSAVLLNTITGEIWDYPTRKVVDKPDKNLSALKIDYDIPPAGSLLLYVFLQKQPESFPLIPAEKQYTAIQESSPIVAAPQESNVLTIDFCDLQLGNETFPDLHQYDAADKTFKAHGFTSGNPWNTSVQYKDNIVSRDTFKTGGFKATYKFTVAEDFDKSGMKAVIERAHLYKISLNGQEITPEPGKWWLDRDMNVLSIGDYVKKGVNNIVLELSPMKIMAEIEPIYILGNFTLQSAAKGWTIHAPSPSFTVGSWKAQGWPFYAGIVSYSKNYEISDANIPYRVSIGNWEGTVAEVTVNGKSAGIVYSKPYSIEVSKWMKTGSNTVTVKIVGSNKNLLGPFHSGDKGIASPWHFRNVKTYPEGNSYRQLDYGLTDDFQLEAGYGNPLFQGWYADPEGVVYDDTYWVYPTWSDAFEKQTYFDCFSSKDLVNWTKHASILDTAEVKWAKRAMWAPSVIHKDGKYYFFFAANDVHEGEIGGIGVSVSDAPEGPYRDLLGKPLINEIVNGAQPIDQFVFNDNGQYYLYYGGWRHCNIVKLKSDFTALEPFDDGTTYKEITPENYVEGPFMFKKDNKYYFMWSEGGWTGPDYCVAYAIADSPFGPFKRIGKILQQDDAVATGAGHHSVIRIPNTDEYYIVYHRHPLGDNNGNHRVTCIDRLTFNENGLINPVKITFEGVEARIIDKK